MGRPPKSSDQRRSEVIRFAVRPDEYAMIRKAANAARMTLSAYARAMCFEGRVVIKQTRSLDPDAYFELRKIGTNLNQAVHKFHATGKVPPDLESAARTVEDFILSRLDDDP